MDTIFPQHCGPDAGSRQVVTPLGGEILSSPKRGSRLDHGLNFCRRRKHCLTMNSAVSTPD